MKSDKIRKRVNILINILMVGFTCVFIASSVFKYLDYKNNPDKYAMWSAPWYTSIQIMAIVLIITLSVCIVIKIFIKKRGK